MKAVFVGGGAVRLVGILRAALHHGGMFEDGEINLYDLNVARAEAVAHMLMKTPEFARVKCKLTWGSSLESALEGADIVGVILMAPFCSCSQTSRHGISTSLFRPKNTAKSPPVKYFSRPCPQSLHMIDQLQARSADAGSPPLILSGRPA